MLRPTGFGGSSRWTTHPPTRSEECADDPAPAPTLSPDLWLSRHGPCGHPLHRSRFWPRPNLRCPGIQGKPHWSPGPRWRRQQLRPFEAESSGHAGLAAPRPVPLHSVHCPGDADGTPQPRRPASLAGSLTASTFGTQTGERAAPPHPGSTPGSRRSQSRPPQHQTRTPPQESTPAPPKALPPRRESAAEVRGSREDLSPGRRPGRKAERRSEKRSDNGSVMGSVME